MDRIQEDENERARKLTEANHRAADLIVKKLKVAEEEIASLKSER